MLAEERTELGTILVDAARGLLLAQGLRFEPLGEKLCASQPSGTLAASIGLSGPGSLRGKLVLIAQPEFFRTTYPLRAGGEAPPEEAVIDWAAEMANQMLGRMKNLLSSRSIDFTISIPTVLRGDRLELLLRHRAGSIERCVRVDGQMLGLLLEMERADGGPLSSPGGQVESRPEGSALLF